MDMIDQLNRALDYVEENLANEIDYAKIAEAAYESPYHFQRMFTAVTRVPLSEYIRRRRLSQAALDLQGTGDKVLDIALRYGYSSPDSFARAFKAVHGILPSQARMRGVQLKAYPRMIFALTIKGVIAMNYRMVEKEAFKVVGVKEWTTMENEQNSINIPQMWEKMPEQKAKEIEALADTDLTGLLGICGEAYNNGFEYWIAAATTKPCPQSLDALQIPAHTWAVFESVGPMPNAIQDTWGRIFSEWFPNSGYEHAPAPDFEWYSFGDMAAADYKSEVWIPVVKK